MHLLLAIFISQLFSIFIFSDSLSLNGGERASVSSTITTSSTGDSDSNSNESLSQSNTNQPGSIDSSSADEGGPLPSNCLPCLTPISVVPCVEKGRSLSSSPPSSRKKASLKLSYKWREGHASGALCKYSHLIPWINILITYH